MCNFVCRSTAGRTNVLLYSRTDALNIASWPRVSYFAAITARPPPSGFVLNQLIKYENVLHPNKIEAVPDKALDNEW